MATFWERAARSVHPTVYSLCIMSLFVSVPGHFLFIALKLHKSASDQTFLFYAYVSNYHF